MYSQVNYVPNPSFEILDSCAMQISSSIQRAFPWDTLVAKGGCAPSANNICCNTDPRCYPNLYGVPLNLFGNNFQYPRTGKGYSSFLCFAPIPLSFTLIASYRGYIQAPLAKKLINNKSYCVTFFVALGSRSKYALDELGAYFDDGSVSAPGYCRPLTLTAQVKGPPGFFYTDTLNWVKIQGSFTANGTESYITLGYFKDQQIAINTASIVNTATNAANSGYNWDDISVIEADLPAYAGRDTVLCIGDSVFIGRPPEIGLECLWFNNGSQIATGGGLWVKPVTTQTYMVQQDVCGLIKRDTVQVQIKPKYNGPNIALTVNSPTACPTNTITLTVTNNPPGANTKYNWLPVGVYSQTSNLSAQAIMQQSTTFTITATNNGENSFCPFQRTASVSVSVPVYTDTPALSSNLNPACPQDTIILSVQPIAPGNLLTYQWLPKSAFTFTSNISAKSLIQQSLTYTINISSSGNNSLCPFTRTLNITVNIPDTCFKEPVIPNIFTPNNDDVNDEWTIKFPLGYSLQELKVYNRWGTLMYEQNNLSFSIQNSALIAWDGRTNSGEECSVGVYFYVMKYTDKSGSAKLMKGNLTLMK